MSAGLIGFAGGVGKGMAVVAEKAIDDEYSRMKEERIAENALRMDETKRSRDLAGAATERARVETDATTIAGRRKVTPPDVAAQTDASAIALEKAYEAGTIPDSVKQQGLIGLSEYATNAAVPNTKVTARDRLQAQGKHEELARLEQRDNEHAAAMDDKAADNTRLNTALGETIRHNKALEDNAAEKLTPAARANLEMASTYVTSAHKAEAEAAKALDAARKDTMADPAKVAQLERDYQQSKAVVASALAQYNKIGATHFPDQWQPITPDSVVAAPTGTQPVRVGGKVIGHASTKAEADALVAKHKKGGSSAPTDGGGLINKPVVKAEAPTAADYANVEAAKAARKEKADREAAERMEKQRKRGEEIDAFNARMRKN